jgi:hypothetical protein
LAVGHDLRHSRLIISGALRGPVPQSGLPLMKCYISIPQTYLFRRTCLAPDAGMLAGKDSHSYGVGKSNPLASRNRYELCIGNLFKLHQPHCLMGTYYGRAGIVGNPFGTPKMVEVGMTNQNVVSPAHFGCA